MKTYVYIGAGGFAGAVIRYLVKGMHLSGYDGAIPLQTLAVNTLGAFVLAFLLTIALEIKEFNYKLLPGLSVGLLGALTTFSTLCKEAVSLTMSGYVFDAVAYILFSVLAGFVCAWGGTVLARRVGRARQNRFGQSQGLLDSESDVDG